MDSKITIGGQALIEGVMMRSKDRYAIAVRKPNKEISVKIIPIKKPKYSFMNWPILRGFFRFIETLVIGIQSLSYSASESQGEKEEAITKKEFFFMLVFSIGLTLLLFYALPLVLTRLITNGKWFNLIDGILRLVIFLAYIVIISYMPDIKRVFQYHGAEHKTVYCYENKEKLTVKNVQKYTTLHPRCGTNFILIVFVMSIFFFTIVNVQGFFYRFAVRILMLPLIAGVSYELLKFAGNHFENKLVKIMVWPGLMLQKITTKEPDDDMVEVAIKSMKAVL